MEKSRYDGPPSAPEIGNRPPENNEYPPAYPGYPPPQSGYQPTPEIGVHQGYPPPPPLPTQPDFAAPYTPPTYGWFEDSQRNKPQSNSLAAATLIFISGGMSFAWSVGFAPVYLYLSKAAQTHMQICWFVAVIIGACIATLLVEKVTKRLFYFAASILVLINGVLFLSASESVTAVIIARYCDGIAFGLCIIPAIVAGSEQSVKRFRGLVLSTEQIGITTGIMLQAIYTSLWTNNSGMNSNQMHGTLTLVYGVLALLFTLLFAIESPIFYLRKDNEPEAINALRRLQKPQIVTTETYYLLYENKHLMEEDALRGRAVNLSAGLIPLIKTCLFRAFVTLSFSLPLTWGLAIASLRNNAEWSLYMYTVMRVIGVFVAIFTVDTLGRKGPSSFSLLIGGGLLIGVGSVFSSYWNVLHSEDMETVIALLMVYQLFAGLMAPASTSYLGEAFSISVKPFFILIVVLCENVIQIIVCCAFDGSITSMSDYGYAVGALQIVFAIVFFLVMPETKQTTLREALAKFKQTVNTGTS